MTRERKAEQMKLVQKYFQREKQSTDMLQQKIVDKAENLRRQYSPRSKSETRNDAKISREEALQLGEERRQNAIQRRQEFLKSETKESRVKMSTVQMTKHQKKEFQEQRFNIQQQERQDQSELSQQVSTSDRAMRVDVKSRKQIERERDEIVQQTIMNYQIESQTIAKRVKEEEDKRIKMIQEEKSRLEEETKFKQEALRRMEEATEQIRIKKEEERKGIEKQQ